MRSPKTNWTDHTFWPWTDTPRISSHCDYRYDESIVDEFRRRGLSADGKRVRASEAIWHEPLLWNERAQKQDVRRRVLFTCADNLCDETLPPRWRADLFRLVDRTRRLDWLFLTERPENLSKMLPLAIEGLRPWPWRNVWLGTTATDQNDFDRRWATLSKIPAAVRFISYERPVGGLVLPVRGPVPDWVICGGETSAKSRVFERQWARNLMHDCRDHDVPFFMKPMTKKAEIPRDLLLREFPRGRLKRFGSSGSDDARRD